MCSSRHRGVTVRWKSLGGVSKLTPPPGASKIGYPVDDLLATCGQMELRSGRNLLNSPRFWWLDAKGIQIEGTGFPFERASLSRSLHFVFLLYLIFQVWFRPGRVEYGKIEFREVLQFHLNSTWPPLICILLPCCRPLSDYAGTWSISCFGYLQQIYPSHWNDFIASIWDRIPH